MRPRGGMMGPLNETLPGGHGAVGEIISINLPQIIINGPDNLEKIILISASTTIRQFQENIQAGIKGIIMSFVDESSFEDTLENEINI